MKIDLPFMIAGIIAKSPFDASLFNAFETSVWQEHKWETIGLSALLLFQAVLILILVLNRSKRKTAEAELSRLADLAKAEHQHLDEVVSNLPGLVWESRLSADGSRAETFVSQQVERMLGYSVEEWLADPKFWLTIIPQEEQAEALKRCDEILLSGKSGVIQFRWRTKDGRLLWVEEHLSTIFDENNKPVGLRGVTLDISDRKSAEESLRASKERNQALLRAIPDLMFVQDEAGTYLDYYAADNKTLIASPESFIGKNMREILPEELANEAFEKFAIAKQSRETQVLEYSVPIADQDRWFEARIVYTESDKFLSIIRDITDQRSAENALRESEARFKNMANSAPLMVWMSGLNNQCTFVSRSWLEFTGRTLEEELGGGWLESIHPDDLQSLLSSFTKAFDAREPMRMEFRLKRFDGEYRWLHDEGVPRYTPEGTFAGYVGACVDFTERKMAEEGLRDALAEVEKLRDQLQQENIYLREQVEFDHVFQEIVGSSDQMKYLLFKIQQVAPTNTGVLIQGETGTGKELVARAIHNASGRKGRTMVKINCATLPASLIESELFGHEKGAFTGAQAKKPGRFEVADGGTLFLDEIGELPLELQSRLLRVLQEGEFERLGSSQTRKVDVRIIAATNRDLKQEVQNGRFREDLWYRLNVFPITVPPLRQRKSDIPVLVNFFVNQFNRKLGRNVNTVSPQTMRRLQDYFWPGNVRELANVVERALINSGGATLNLTDKLDASAVSLSNESSKMPGTLEEVEREHIKAVLNLCEWRIEGPNGAATILGINSSTLRSRMAKLGIRRSTHTAATQ